MDVSHSVYVNVGSDFISITELCLTRRQDLSVLKHGYLRSEENVNLNKFQYQMVYECWSVAYHLPYTTSQIDNNICHCCVVITHYSVHKITGHTNTHTPSGVGIY